MPNNKTKYKKARDARQLTGVHPGLPALEVRGDF
jgi:hypothetical protein